MNRRLLRAVLVVGTLVMLATCPASSQQIVRPVITSGVLYKSLPELFSVGIRYPVWSHMMRAQSTVWPEGFVDEQPPSQAVIQRHDRDLAELGVSCDAIQYDPTASSNLVNFRSGYESGSDRCFFLLYESVFAGGYERDRLGQIDLSRSHNQVTLLAHMASMFYDVILPNQHRYLVTEVTENGKTEKRAWIYLWNMNPYEGDVRAAFERVRSFLPVYLLGGDVVLHPPLIEVQKGRPQASNTATQLADEQARWGRAVKLLWQETPHLARAIERVYPGFLDRGEFVEHPHIRQEDGSHQHWWESGERWEALLSQTRKDGLLVEPSRVVTEDHDARQRLRQLQHLRVLDVFMPYAIYDSAFTGSFSEMVAAYFTAARLWRDAIQEVSPGTLQFTAFTPAFDDHKLRGAANPPKVPNSPDEVLAHLGLNHLLYLRGAAGGGPNIVWGEPYEGMAAARNEFHVRGFLAGPGVIRLLREGYFGFFPAPPQQ